VEQGLGTIGGLSVLGVELTHIRGVDPSACLLKTIPQTLFDRFTGTLQFSFAAQSISLSGMAVAAAPLELWYGRDGYRWNVVALDRRWKWRYPRISGEYNGRLCDNSINSASRKNARELAELLLDALGESSYDVSGVPDDVYPYVLWDNSLAKLELASLCDLLGMDVCPHVANDQFAVRSLTATASIPAGTVIYGDQAAFKPAVMPSSLQVVGAPKKYQGLVELEPVALDSSGDIRAAAAVSYAPGGGWNRQWPSAFPGVTQAARHLPVQTIWRWYQPVDATIILDEHVVETGLDAERNELRCLPPQVSGVFWTFGDHATNTGVNAVYSGNFRVRKDLNLVEFEYPVWRWSSGEILPALLWINAGYYIKNSAGALQIYTRNQAVPQAVVSTAPRVLKHHELHWTSIGDALYGASSGNNETDVQAEADVYLSSLAATYSFDKSRTVVLNGLVSVDLLPPITQVKWRCGNQRPAFTFIGINQECDIHTPDNQDRRTRQRVDQLFDESL
jgi:hypothetical protein